LPDGPVLVVGASASGVQIAEELQRAGRDVMLAVGRHTRVPRSYRGVDIHSWLEQLGDLDRARDAGDRRRVEPSLQLIGRPADQPLDLGTLQSLGVRLTGRVAAVTADRVAFSDDLDAHIAAADARLHRLLHRIDAHVDRAVRRVTDTSALERHLRDIPPPVVAPRALRSVPLGGAGIRGVVWATGFARAYPWLRLPVFDHRGEIAHHRGVTTVPGCFTIGMQFQTRRRSTFIDGVRFDAAEIAARLDCPASAPARAREYADLAS
jgi:putative flavoprotein involved in K+ transport